ncbi:MAG: helix-turn-helix domain-containing protein [Candidatus Saccharimonadales bacterium]|jgi:HAD superfamily hydrolase (TIGR01509 family)
MDEKTLGHKLQLARKQAGLTQQQLCQKAGLSYSTLAKIERGAIRSPSVFTVASIASATGVPLTDLLGTNVHSSPALTPAKKRSKNGVTFVYFDVNGTLVCFFHRAFTEIARACGQQPDFVETLYWRYNDGIVRGDMSLEKFNAALGKELGLDDFDWQKYYMANVEPVPGVEEFVEWAAQHYEVGLISNNMPGFIDEMIHNKIVPDVKYTVAIDSSKVGIIKPEAKIYELGQEMAAVEPREILLIDNERPNLIAADRAGWQVIWFDDLDPEDSIERAKAALEF